MDNSKFMYSKNYEKIMHINKITNINYLSCFALTFGNYITKFFDFDEEKGNLEILKSEDLVSSAIGQAFKFRFLMYLQERFSTKSNEDYNGEKIKKNSLYSNFTNTFMYLDVAEELEKELEILILTFTSLIEYERHVTQKVNAGEYENNIRAIDHIWNNDTEIRDSNGTWDYNIFLIHRNRFYVNDLEKNNFLQSIFIGYRIACRLSSKEYSQKLVKYLKNNSLMTQEEKLDFLDISLNDKTLYLDVFNCIETQAGIVKKLIENVKKTHIVNK